MTEQKRAVIHNIPNYILPGRRIGNSRASERVFRRTVTVLVRRFFSGICLGTPHIGNPSLRVAREKSPRMPGAGGMSCPVAHQAIPDSACCLRRMGWVRSRTVIPRPASSALLRLFFNASGADNCALIQIFMILVSRNGKYFA